MRDTLSELPSARAVGWGPEHSTSVPKPDSALFRAGHAALGRSSRLVAVALGGPAPFLSRILAGEVQRRTTRETRESWAVGECHES